ncbi:MAG TPA: Ig-like domain-containing protein [Mycobacteriales bacterium]|jgi:hypothetical protein|nr:Ig-like domain-containing protein [Mycobacteriales bacterium]
MRRLVAGISATVLIAASAAAATTVATADPSQPAAVCSGATCTTTYGASAAIATFTVPSFVTQLAVTVDGAEGGRLRGKGGTSKPGGLGGQTTLDAAVAPGDVLSVIVGGSGGDIEQFSPGTSGGAGGYAGGASGGSSGGQIPATGGGGGSFVFFANGLLMAAAGGGGGRSVTGVGGSGGGGVTGFVGGVGGDGSDSATGGQPGTGVIGGDGAGGAGTSQGASQGSPGTGEVNGPSTLPVGGAGGSGGYGGGGGGGGSHSGGGGGSDNNASMDASSGGGGGGGSGYYDGALTTDVSGGAGVVSGNGSVSIAYAKGGTDITASVQPRSLSATVAPVTAGAVTPTGTVSFAVDGEGVGSAPLVDGVATLTDTVPVGATHHIDVTYTGDDNYLGSSGSAVRSDPTITATLHSAKPASRYHWYRRPVTVTFRCQATTGAIQNCPKTATLRRNGARQTLSRTVTAADGGAAMVTVAGINIDQVKPKVVIRGPKNGAVYHHKPPKARCVAHDPLSGVAKCVIHKRDLAARNLLIATATDKAGNVAHARLKYRRG